MDRLETEHGIFTSNHVNGESAEEVYAKWLANKDNKIDSSPVKTNEDLTKENMQLKTALADTQDLLIELSNQVF